MEAGSQSPSRACAGSSPLRRYRLHQLIDHLPEAELLAAELFLELLAGSDPGLTVEDLSHIEAWLRGLQAKGNLRTA